MFTFLHLLLLLLVVVIVVVFWVCYFIVVCNLVTFYFFKYFIPLPNCVLSNQYCNKAMYQLRTGYIVFLILNLNLTQCSFIFQTASILLVFQNIQCGILFFPYGAGWG